MLSKTHWQLADLPWQDFTLEAVNPDHVSLIKCACLVEHNSDEYARYLSDIFHDAPATQALMRQWAAEEVQHGEALRRYAKLADPSFDFDVSFAKFTDKIQLPSEINESIRGSRVGEMVSRCVIETGTSSFYTAIKDASGEPLLRAICQRLAADEFRHYKLFYNILQQYLPTEQISKLQRLKIAITRLQESSDDELAYAYYIAHDPEQMMSYDRQACLSQYFHHIQQIYRPLHIQKMTKMIFKAAGMRPYPPVQRLTNGIAWFILQKRKVK